MESSSACVKICSERWRRFDDKTALVPFQPCPTLPTGLLLRIAMRSQNVAQHCPLYSRALSSHHAAFRRRELHTGFLSGAILCTGLCALSTWIKAGQVKRSVQRSVLRECYLHFPCLLLLRLLPILSIRLLLSLSAPLRLLA